MKERINLTSIMLTVTGARAQALVTGPLTSGMVGIPITIQYDEVWEGLTKNLVCRCSGRDADSTEQRAILNVGTSAVVAHEVMQADRHLYLGLEGFSPDGKLVIPTTWAMCGVIQTGASTGEDLSADPTLPVWEQLQTEIGQIRQEAVTSEQVTEILSGVQTAVQAAAVFAGRAESAATRAEEAAGSAGCVTDERLAKAMADYLAENPVGSAIADYGFLRGKKYYALGDSIVQMQGTMTNPETFGDCGYNRDLQNRVISGITVEGYVGAIERRYGLAATNYGRGGETLVAGYKRLAALDYSDAALVTIAYGVNDAGTGVPLGDVNSTNISTFAGAMNRLLRKIYTDNPECRVVILTPTQRLNVSGFGIDTPNANGHYLIDFCRMCQKVAAKRSTACINMYEVCGINQTNLYYCTVEGVHPVNQGFARMTNAIIPVLDGLFSLPYELFGTMTNTGDTEPEEPDPGSSGSEPPADAEPEPTLVDITGMFTVEGRDMDGWGTGEADIEYQTARYTPVAGKTYSVITYATLDTTDFRGHATSYGCRKDDGTTVGGSISGPVAGLTAGAAVAESVDRIAINGIQTEKIETVFTTAATIDERMWINIGCLDACIDAVVVKYV